MKRKIRHEDAPSGSRRIDWNPENVVLITGAAGFIGQLLATHLLQHDPDIGLLLIDIVKPDFPKGATEGRQSHIALLALDLSSEKDLSDLIRVTPGPLRAAFVLHGIMSSGSEADPALSQKVNLDSTRTLLARLAQEVQPGLRVIYASSQAVYGAPLPDIVTDATTPTPSSVYGTHKLMTEIWLNDMHRRKQLTVFSLRFPTIIVRPGKPTAAASSFLSGMVREPLAGKECIMPLKDRSYRAVVSGPKTLAENLIKVLDLKSDSLSDHVRTMNMPGIAVTVQEILDALVLAGGEDSLRFIKDEPDEGLERILRSWPLEVDCSTALGLGLKRDQSAEQIVREYWESITKIINERFEQGVSVEAISEELGTQRFKKPSG
jgi:nucleoside-diphosphate-sugar epimerase